MATVTKFLVIVIIGIVLILGGLIGYFVISAQVKQALLNEMVIDSKDHKNYEDWLTSYDETDTPSTRQIYLFNLTNPVQFIAGLEKPNFEQVGPFVYKWDYRKTNVTFLDGGARVNWKEEWGYKFVPEESVQADDKQGIITNINPFTLAFINSVNAGGSDVTPFIYAAMAHGLFLQNGLGAAWGTSAAACLPTTPAICGINAVTTAAYSAAIPMNATQSAAVLMSLTDPANIGLIGTVIGVLLNPAAPAATKAGAIAQFAASGVNSTWQGITVEDTLTAQFMGAYLQTVASLATQMVHNVYGGKYGILFNEVSPYDMIFREDPLLTAMGNGKGTSWKGNYTGNLREYTCRTGSDDEHYAGMNYYELYEGRETVTAYNVEEFKVEGRTKSIPPFGGVAPDHMQVYYSTIQRFIEADYTGVTKIKGIPTAVYEFNIEQIVAADPKYKTLVDGMIDLRPTAGTPFFISIPHMWYVPNKYVSRIGGMKQDVTYPSRLHIEETTGLALKGKRQLQLNVLLNFTAMNFTGLNAGPNTNLDVFIPIFYEVEFGEISDDSAKNLKRAVVDAAVIRKLILGILVGFGIALVLIGATLMVQLSGGGNKNGAQNDTNQQQQQQGQQQVQNNQQPQKQAAGGEGNADSQQQNGSSNNEDGINDVVSPGAVSTDALVNGNGQTSSQSKQVDMNEIGDDEEMVGVSPA